MRIKIEKAKTEYEYVKFNGENIQVKPYLTMEEIAEIVPYMLEQSDAVRRRIAKDLSILHICTDIENVEEIDVDDLYQLGIMDLVIGKVKNHCMIDEFVKESQNFSNIISNFAERALKVLDKMSNIDIESAKEKFKEAYGDVGFNGDIGEAVKAVIPQIMEEVTGK